MKHTQIIMLLLIGIMIGLVLTDMMLSYECKEILMSAGGEQV